MDILKCLCLISVFLCFGRGNAWMSVQVCVYEYVNTQHTNTHTENMFTIIALPMYTFQRCSLHPSECT